jgi:type VI secretion system secreted protein VgrG
MKIKRVIPWTRRVLQPANPRLACGPVVGAIGILGLALLLGPGARAQTILGSTASYAVMAGSTVTITGTGTTITGNLGVGGTFTNGGVAFGTPGALVHPLNGTDVADFNKAFTGLNNMATTVNLGAKNLGADVGATTLLPGVYTFTGAAAMTGNLTLDANNQSNAVWVFQIPGTFNTTAGTSVTIINSVGGSVASYGLFWAVTGATVFGANTMFEGNLLDGSTIGFGAGVHIDNGRALTATGTIGLATDTINFVGADSGYSGGLAFDGGSVVAVPEPAATSVLIAGFLGLIVGIRRIRRHNC